MDKPKATPKDFFFWLGAMIALYVSIFSLITLFFEYINRAYPDPLAYYVDPYSSSIRFAIASLMVLAPVFLILMRLIRKDIAANPEKSDLWVRRWALYLTLFVAAATIVIDLVTLVNTYLGGDVTMRFILKAALVLLVAGGGFLHFLADLRGYWQQNPRHARAMSWGAGAVVLATIVAGFFIIGTPGQARLYRFDDQKISHLQTIQWQVVSYWQSKEKLPATLQDLNDPLSNFIVPVDPQSGASYTYQAVDAHSFKLCATFNAEMQAGSSQYSYARPIMTDPVAPGKDLQVDSWEHGVGETCYLRTIDPERYPPFKK